MKPQQKISITRKEHASNNKKKPRAFKRSIARFNYNLFIKKTHTVRRRMYENVLRAGLIELTSKVAPVLKLIIPHYSAYNR